MYLLYINEIGRDYKGQKQYEFIFGEDVNVLMDEWLEIPSSGNSVPPEIDFIDEIGVLKDSDLDLILIQNSYHFGVIDAVNGIVALGWEPFDINYEKRIERLYFKFGEELNSVEEKLSRKNIKLILEKIKK